MSRREFHFVEGTSSRSASAWRDENAAGLALDRVAPVAYSETVRDLLSLLPPGKT